jgi:hypothetical protein
MHMILRTHSGDLAMKVFELIASNYQSIDTSLRACDGFVSYTLARSGDQGYSITIAESKSATEEVIRRAKQWVVDNAHSLGLKQGGIGFDARSLEFDQPTETEARVLIHAV